MCCESWSARIIDRLAGELGDEEAILLEQHLAECARCSDEERRLREVTSAAREDACAVRGPRRESPAPGPLLLAELRRARSEHGAAAARPATTLIAFFRRPLAAYATLALVLAGLATGFWMGRSSARPESRALPATTPAETRGGAGRTPLLAGTTFAVTPADAIPGATGSSAEPPR